MFRWIAATPPSRPGAPVPKPRRVDVVDENIAALPHEVRRHRLAHIPKPMNPIFRMDSPPHSVNDTGRSRNSTCAAVSPTSPAARLSAICSYVLPDMIGMMAAFCDLIHARTSWLAVTPPISPATFASAAIRFRLYALSNSFGSGRAMSA